MADLVGIDYATSQCRIDPADVDGWLNVAIDGITQAVVRWCGGDESKLCDAEGNAWPDVVTAILVEIAYQYANREGPAAAYQQDWYANGYPLSAGCIALLQPYHKPVCA